MNKTIIFNLNDKPIETFRKCYEDFLTYEHTTPNKELWVEQKKIYQEIFNASDPDLALEEFYKKDMTTAEFAEIRLKK